MKTTEVQKKDQKINDLKQEAKNACSELKSKNHPSKMSRVHCGSDVG
ncbi:MAG: hypothetical protein K9L59_10925 [Desulfobacterales bacterium]|nr:hypothetical protein [Desulfobacterales bacterium]